MSNETLPIQYLNYTIDLDKNSDWNKYIAYPTEEGIQHDADYDGDHYKYTGNCLFDNHIENLKAEIDEKQPVEKQVSGFGHNLQEEARTYESIKGSLELCLLKAMETFAVRVGDINWVNMNSLIEKYDIMVTKAFDHFNSKT